MTARRAREILDRRFPGSGRELHIAGQPVGDLVERWGSPTFAYDRQIMRDSYTGLRHALPELFEIVYSVKANPHETAIQTFLEMGAGLEIASAGELRRALEAGCPPERILFAGPGKSLAELSASVEAGIGEIHVESPLEISRLAEVSAGAGRVTSVAIRVNPDSSAAGGAMQMGGKPAPFGIDEEDLDDALDAVLSHPSLSLTGVHLFAGTQILDAGVLLAQYGKAFDLAERVSRRIGRPLHTIDVGGGLGIPYFEKDQPLDLDQLSIGTHELVEQHRSSPAIDEHTRVVVEPGRYLVGESGVYLVTVTDIKISRGKRFVVLDGGMHHHLAASGNLGQVIKRNYPIVAAQRLDEDDLGPAEVVGPLCTPLDTIGRGLDLPAVEVGDILAVLQSGAYGLTASPTGFLSHEPPGEIWLGEE